MQMIIRRYSVLVTTVCIIQVYVQYIFLNLKTAIKRVFFSQQFGVIRTFPSMGRLI